MDKKGTGVFLVILIISVLVTVLIMVWSSKQTVDEYNKSMQQVSAGEAQAKEIGDTLQQMQDEKNAEYGVVDQNLGE
ncbi:MAG: hypothetical protein K6A72_08345 [Lachnospiraceae bacterium]|jgi:uncharacterized membrane protein (DUF106 family)|nr:hypothetical protein [Lachnospiraceae bacterium]